MSHIDELRKAQEMEAKFRSLATADHPEYLSMWQFWQNRVQASQADLPETLRDNAGPNQLEDGTLLLDSATPQNRLRSDINALTPDGRINFQPDPLDATGKKLPGGADINMAYERNHTLQPGMYIRYGGEKGSYLLPVSADFRLGRDNPELKTIFDQMGLPYEYNPESWNVVTVKEPIDGCALSVIGDQKGFGLDSNGDSMIKGGRMQYQLPDEQNIESLSASGKMTMTRLPPRMSLQEPVDLRPPQIDTPIPLHVDQMDPASQTVPASPPPPPPTGSPHTSLGDRYQSSYADRIRQTPSLESNRWGGERGESICAPQSDAARQILEERGMTGVVYQNGMPDFSPFSESTVQLGYMTDSRHSSGLSSGRDSKNSIYARFENGEMVESYHHADKNSMADLHMKYDKPGNYEQADILTAEQWSADGKDGKEWTAEDVAQYRKDNGLTWHECNDMETMQMVPEAINADFGHLGGVAEVKETQRIIDEVLSQEDDGQWLEDESFDQMSKEELDAFTRENGYYDEDGVWVPDATSIDEPLEEPLEEPLDEPAEEPVEEPIDEPAEEPVEEPIDEPAEEPVEEPIEEPIDEAVEEPLEEPLDEPVEEPVEEPIDEPAEEPVEEPIDEPVEEPIEEPIDEPAEEPIDELIDEPTEEPVEEPVDEPAEEPVDDFLDADESSDNLDVTDHYSDLSDEDADTPDETMDSIDDLSDEDVVDEYDTSEDFSDLSDDVNDDFIDEPDYSDDSDNELDEPMDSSDYTDISDDVDSQSYDDSSIDDCDSFDGGGDSID